MFTKLKNFIKSEDGAITVDWVVLTAGLVGLGLAVIAVIGAQTTDTSDSLGQFVSDVEIKSTF